jgi:protein-S-isoprenylcysteine O-methyltransferase Ste14
VEKALELFAVIQFVTLGLSHVFQRHAWVDFFTWLRERGHAGVFVHGFLSLGFGSMVLAFHHVWTGVPSVLTVVGCLYLVKAGLCFLWPQTQMRTLKRVSHERAWELAVPGVAYVILGGLLSYNLWAG